MNLKWQLKIIDDLIREDPESTIADYNELLTEKDVTVTYDQRKNALSQLKKLYPDYLRNITSVAVTKIEKTAEDGDKNKIRSAAAGVPGT